MADDAGGSASPMWIDAAFAFLTNLSNVGHVGGSSLCTVCFFVLCLQYLYS